MPFQQPFLMAGKQIVENTSSCRIKFIISVIISFYIKPRLSALGQPLWMAANTLDWGDSLNRRHRWGKRNTTVMMFVGGVVFMLGRFLVLLLL
jgi:hypothetical protein